MLKHSIFLVVFLVFGLIGMIRVDDYNKDFFMHVNVNNEGEKDLDDLSVSVYIYELGVYLKTGNFDLQDGDTTGKLLFWDIPRDIALGKYWARVTVSNDDVREVEHRIVTIA